MKVLVWLVRGILFVVLLGLAVKNSELVDLRFYLDSTWQAPLSVVILVAFATGVVVGFTSTVTARLRQGRELRRLRKRDESESGANKA